MTNREAKFLLTRQCREVERALESVAQHAFLKARDYHNPASVGAFVGALDEFLEAALRIGSINSGLIRLVDGEFSAAASPCSAKYLLARYVLGVRNCLVPLAVWSEVLKSPELCRDWEAREKEGFGIRAAVDYATGEVKRLVRFYERLDPEEPFPTNPVAFPGGSA